MLQPSRRWAAFGITKITPKSIYPDTDLPMLGPAPCDLMEVKFCFTWKDTEDKVQTASQDMTFIGITSQQFYMT